MSSNFETWLEGRELGEDAPKILNEATAASRYSIEVNYRSTMEEVLEGFAKLTLGYISAAMKNCGYHCKVVLTDKPMRVLVSTRNWDDGEWIGIVVFNPNKGCFVIGRGSYNKDRKTISVDKSKPCDGKSAAEIVKQLRNDMESMKRESPRGSNTLQPANLKRGPKPTHLKKLTKSSGPWKPKNVI